MCRCEICGPQSHHEAEFSVSIGNDDRELKVCCWCSQDLRVLGARLISWSVCPGRWFAVLSGFSVQSAAYSRR